MARGRVSRKSIVGNTRGTTANIKSVAGASVHSAAPSGIPMPFHPQAKNTAIPRKR